MGKMFNAIALTLAINLSMFLFVVKSNGESGYSNNVMYSFFLNPTGWTGAPLYITLAAVALSVGLAGIFIGTLSFKSDFIVFASVIGPMLTFGSTIFALWIFIASQSFWDGNSGEIIASLIAGILAVWYLMCVLDWWRTPNS